MMLVTILLMLMVTNPQPRYLDCEEAYKQCLWLENRGYKVLKEHQVNINNL